MKGDVVAFTLQRGSTVFVEDDCGCGSSDCIETQAHMEMASRLVSFVLSGGWL